MRSITPEWRRLRRASITTLAGFTISVVCLVTLGAFLLRPAFREAEPDQGKRLYTLVAARSGPVQEASHGRAFAAFLEQQTRRNTDALADALWAVSPHAAALDPAAPDVTATKTDNRSGSEPASPGAEIDYTVEVANAGDAPATTVRFIDTVDANTTLVAGSVNASPLALDGMANVSPGGTVLVTLSGTDADGDALGFVLVSGPANGTLSESGTDIATFPHTLAGNTVSYTHDGSATASDVFTFRANDGDVDSNEDATVTVAVNDDAPTVESTTPADGATDVVLTTNVAVTFSEAVTVSGSWFGITCTTSGAHTAVVTGGPTTFTLNPDTDFVNSESCEVTIVAAQVSDQDTNDPPDNMAADYTFSFTTPDAPPTVTSTDPLDGATSVLSDATVTITFSEAVDIVASAFSVECPAGTPTGFSTTPALPTSTGTTSIDLDPTTNWPGGETCTVSIEADKVSDTDLVDPPDNLDGDEDGTDEGSPTDDYSFTFSVAPAAINDAYTASGNIGIEIAADGVLDNDEGASLQVSEVQGSGSNVGASIATTAVGRGGVTGFVTLNANGSFTYEPPPGYVGDDTFTYKVSNGTSTSNAATVTITISQMAWFVNNSASGSSNVGTFSNPFTTIASFNAAQGATAPSPKAGDYVALRTGTGTYAETDGINLQDTQVLLGGAAQFDDFFTADANSSTAYETFAAGTSAAPVITATGGNGVELASGNAVRGLNVGNTSGYGFSGSAVGNLTINTVSVTGTGGALQVTTSGAFGTNVNFSTLESTSSAAYNVNLVGVTGTLGVASGGAGLGGSAANFSAVVVSGGTVSLSYPGSISKTSSGSLVNVSNGHSTGTLAFTGTLNATAGDGLQFSNADGTYSFSGTTTLGSGDAGIDIVGGSSGTFTFGTGTSISNPTGTAFYATASAPTVTMNGPITQGAARRGVYLENNTGGTFTFTGTLSLATTTQNAFEATHTSQAGTVVVQTATNNVLSTTTGTALRVNNVNIGAGGLTFQSISANGATNGIVLNNTGTSGGLTVAGNGGICSTALNCTGGAIQNTTGVGVSLTNASDVSLTRMYLANTGSHGISGTGMVDAPGANPTFALLNSFMESPGDADNESALFFDALGVTNITGTMQVASTTIQNFEDVGILVGNVSGTLTLNVSDVNIINNSDSNGEEGIDVDASGTATINVNVSGNSFFRDLEGGGMNVVSQGSGTIDMKIDNAVVIGTGGPDNFPTPPAMTFSAEGTSSNFFFNITNNKILDSSGDGIFIGHEGEIEGSITGNVITGMALGDGIRIDTDATGNQTATILIQSNQIGTLFTFESVNHSGIGDDGIQVLHRDGTKTLNLTIDDNTIANTASEGIRYFADDDVAGGGPENQVRIANNTFTTIGDPNTIIIISQDPGTAACTHIASNTLTTGNLGITLQQSLSATLQITQASTAALATANDGGATVVTPTGTITFNGTCTTPPLPDNPVNLVNSLIAPDAVAPLTAGDSFMVTASLPLSGERFSTGEATPSVTEVSPVLAEAAGTESIPVGMGSDRDRQDEPLPQTGGFALASAPAEPSTVEDNVQEAARLAVSEGDAPAVLVTTFGDEPAERAVLEFSSPEPIPGITLAAADPLVGLLAAAEYRIVRDEAAEHAEATALSGETVNLTIGTLPAGRSVTITFQVTVNAAIAATEVSNQGTVTADGGISVVTDDPDTGTASDATVTPIVTDGDPPVVSNVNATPNPAPVGTAVSLSAGVSDVTTGGSNVASAEFSFDGGAWTAMDADATTPAPDGFDSPTENVTASLGSFTEAGLHTACVRASDAAGNQSSGTDCVSLAVYDPNAGFVTGAGTILSPPGAYLEDPNLTGPARFAFQSQYKKGRSTPQGNTQFTFNTAGLDFASTAYEYLIVAGAKAQFKGQGLINGEGPVVGGAYKFILSAIDEGVNTTDGFTVDLFRIRIWYEDAGEQVVYDNSLGEASCGVDETADPCTALASGSIMIHTPKGKNGNQAAGKDAAGTEQLPSSYALEQNYPNPFNPQTEIAFDLPETAQVRLVVYDVRGREVERLVDGQLAAGKHRVTWLADGLPSGVYLYRLTAGSFVATRQMTLVK